MRKNIKDKSISSDAYEYLLHLIKDEFKIVDLSVKGKWLVAELDSGVRFEVLNK